MEGLPEDNGNIRAAIFASELQSFLSLLRETNFHLARYRKSTFDLKIIDLSHRSPATVVFEAVPKDTEDYDWFEPTINHVFDLFEDIQEQVPMATVDNRLLEALQKFVKPLGQKIDSLKIMTDGRVIKANKEFSAKVDLAIAPEENFPGSIRGVLEYLNLHDENRTFRIYPDIGPSKVNCIFPDELTERAIKAIRSFVEVHGILHQKKVADFPNEIEVQDIDIFPPDDELPTLSDLRGMSPDATGDLTSVEYVRKVRDEQ